MGERVGDGLGKVVKDCGCKQRESGREADGQNDRMSAQWQRNKPSAARACVESTVHTQPSATASHLFQSKLCAQAAKLQACIRRIQAIRRVQATLLTRATLLDAVH